LNKYFLTLIICTQEYAVRALADERVAAAVVVVVVVVEFSSSSSSLLSSV